MHPQCGHRTPRKSLINNKVMDKVDTHPAGQRGAGAGAYNQAKPISAGAVRAARRGGGLDTDADGPTLGEGDSGRVRPRRMPMRSRFATGVSAVVVSIVVVGTSLAGDAVQSGLKVGEPVNPFLVDDITGPNKGKTLCYR